MIKVKIDVRLKEGNYLCKEELEIVAIPRIGEKLVASGMMLKIDSITYHTEYVSLMATKEKDVAQE